MACAVFTPCDFYAPRTNYELPLYFFPLSLFHPGTIKSNLFVNMQRVAHANQMIKLFPTDLIRERETAAASVNAKKNLLSRSEKRIDPSGKTLSRGGCERVYEYSDFLSERKKSIPQGSFLLKKSFSVCFRNRFLTLGIVGLRKPHCVLVPRKSYEFKPLIFFFLLFSRHHETEF